MKSFDAFDVWVHRIGWVDALCCDEFRNRSILLEALCGSFAELRLVCGGRRIFEFVGQNLKLAELQVGKLPEVTSWFRAVRLEIDLARVARGTVFARSQDKIACAGKQALEPIEHGFKNTPV